MPKANTGPVPVSFLLITLEDLECRTGPAVVFWRVEERHRGSFFVGESPEKQVRACQSLIHWAGGAKGNQNLGFVIMAHISVIKLHPGALYARLCA